MSNCLAKNLHTFHGHSYIDLSFQRIKEDQRDFYRNKITRLIIAFKALSPFVKPKGISPI